MSATNSHQTEENHDVVAEADWPTSDVNPLGDSSEVVAEPESVVESVSFAGLTLHPDAGMLFASDRAAIALGADQARVLYLLMRSEGDVVTLDRIERETVNSAAATIESLNSVLLWVGGLSTISGDRERGYLLIDSTADLSLGFADLRLNQVTRLLLVGERGSVTMSPQNTAVLGLLMQAGGGVVPGREVRQVSGRTNSGVAVGNLNRRLRSTGASVVVVNDRGCGWRLVASAA